MSSIALEPLTVNERGEIQFSLHYAQRTILFVWWVVITFRRQTGKV